MLQKPSKISYINIKSLPFLSTLNKQHVEQKLNPVSYNINPNVLTLINCSFSKNKLIFSNFYRLEISPEMWKSYTVYQFYKHLSLLNMISFVNRSLITCNLFLLTLPCPFFLIVNFTLKQFGIEISKNLYLTQICPSLAHNKTVPCRST